MPQPRDVVITGVGMVSPLGVGREVFWDHLDRGVSGVRRLPWFQDCPDIPFQIGGLVANFDAKEFVQPRKTIKVMCNEIQAGYSAGALAMRDAGLAKGALPPERMGVVLGSEMFYGEIDEIQEAFRHCIVDGKFQYPLWGDHAFKDLFPLWMLKYLPNMAACHIGICHDARGPNNTIAQGTVSGLLAIMEASWAIQRGAADVMLAGSCGSRLTLSALPFKGAHLFTRRNEAPEAASRPFDADRDGLVPGEGSAVVVLEAREHAVARNANILARLAAVSSRFESPQKAGGVTGSAIRSSITSAIEKADVATTDIGHVNAHGESSVAHDRVEAQAIQATLGDVPVTAPKSFFGDLGAGAGGMEFAVSVLALATGRVPRTLNYDRPDPACPVNVIHGGTLETNRPAAVVLNQADTGHAVAAVLVRD